MAEHDEDLDRLFQLPLEEFTAARNALAQRLGRPAIKSLAKPHAAAWAVNQLFWRDRQLFDALVRASEALRAEHRKLLAGKAADVRRAETVHREALRDARDAVRRILDGSGQPSSPTTLASVTETLQALPAGERPGRLARPLKPGGFEALAGARFSDTPPALRVVRSHEPPSPKDTRAAKAREKQAREEQRRAEQEARAAQAEVARTEAAVKRARAAVEKAEQQVERLRAALEEARTAHQRARLRARV